MPHSLIEAADRMMRPTMCPCPAWPAGGLGAPDGHQVLRVLGIARAAEDAAGASLEQCQQALVRSLYASQRPWGLLLLGTGAGFELRLTLPGAGAAGLQRLLGACFPGCEAAEDPGGPAVRSRFSRFARAAAVVGNPSLARRDAAPLDALASAMGGEPWAYLVHAYPIAPAEVQKQLDWLAGEEQETIAAYARPGTADERGHPQAEHYLRLVRVTQTSWQAGLGSGMWLAHALFAAAGAAEAARGARALHGAFAGPDCAPQPLRIVEAAPAPELPATCLNSEELARLTTPPYQESAGYRVEERVRFSVAAPRPRTDRRVAIGPVLQDGARTGQWAEIDVDDLTRHALVAGVTGSGKGHTCQFLLDQLWAEHGVPWLVIEPGSKNEYRGLLHKPWGRDLRVYTLGLDTCAPLRLNPLEVLPGVPVQTHIDGVFALFGASFALVTPMPDVLRLALHELYERKGWDLAGGTHPDPSRPGAQPVLSELAALLGRMVPALGYGREVTGNLHAGLVTRLRNLLVGARGPMLDVERSQPLDALLEAPAVLEMSAIGDDDHKAFLMAALLLHLVEHRRAAGLSGGRLRHVTLLEEAHRLLARVPAAHAPEIANPRGRAVESFCNLLAEVRAFGEGLVVVEQSPAKLADDAVNSTNLKIVHRLVAGGDRELTGGATLMNPAQQRHLARLACGEAAVYAEGMSGPMLVRVPDHTRGDAQRPLPADDAVARHMRGRIVPGQPRAAAANGAPRPCPCCSGQCRHQREALRLLRERDRSRAFAAAVDGGAAALWDFALDAVGRGTPDASERAYCLLMNLGAVARFGEAAMASLRAQLSAIRNREGAEDHA